MTREMTTYTRIAAGVLGDGALPEPLPMDDWFTRQAYALGVEEGSGSIDFWDLSDAEGDSIIGVQLACRYQGARIEVKAVGIDDDDAAANALIALGLEIESLKQPPVRRRTH